MYSWVRSLSFTHNPFVILNCTLPIFVGAEVDCVMPLSSSTPPAAESSSQQVARQSTYVELKTHRQIQNPHQNSSFLKHKLLKTYFQCFLAGIPTIVFGFRDDAGFVRRVEHYKTLEVPRLVRRSFADPSEAWDPAVCINFGEEVLATLWRVVERRNRELGVGSGVEGLDGCDVVYQIKMRGSLAAASGSRGDGNRGSSGRGNGGGGGGRGGSGSLVNEAGVLEIYDGVIGNKDLIFVPC
ncbi:RAI1 like PD-XK nuclease-domain-containing protein [Chytriomyces sp. MP71]|nr:RAI1 like PD-XK nuclease-domain-containing protein [Chytriomyces sp. MP71]